MAEAQRAGRPWLAAAGGALAAAAVSPYAGRLVAALTAAAARRRSPPPPPRAVWRVENFAAVLGDPEFQTWLRVSLIVAVASTVLVLLAALPAAYCTARQRFRGRNGFLLLVLVTQMFSPTALVVGLHR